MHVAMHIHAAYPQPQAGHFSSGCLFGLAPDGVCTAICITADAVSSYLAFSPLPHKGAVCFLLHFPSPCGARALPGILPCGVRTFLTTLTHNALCVQRAHAICAPLILLLQHRCLTNLYRIYGYLFYAACL